jgi:hypothetical protein
MGSLGHQELPANNDGYLWVCVNMSINLIEWLFLILWNWCLWIRETVQPSQI